MPFELGDRYYGRWISKWETIARIKAYFDKLTEELIEPKKLINSNDDFLKMFGKSYTIYRDEDQSLYRFRESTVRNIIEYPGHFKDILKRVIETEVDVSVEKDNYIISGKVDLLLGKDQKLEVIDFKSQPRPDAKDQMLNGRVLKKHHCKS